MARPPLHALAGFVAAARTRNLTRAAEGLHLTVSALSHQLRGLEQRLGRQLVERGPRGIALTPDGERLYERIAPHLAAIEDAVRPYAAPRGDVLTLSVLPSMASAWLVPRLPRFMAAHPQVELNLQSSLSLVDFERDRGVDAALRFGPGGWAGVEAVHLFDDWLTPSASPALLRGRSRPTLSSLGELPLLGDPGRRWPDWFRAFGGRAPSRFVAAFDDSETLHRAAAEGLGVALGRMTLAQPYVDAGRLKFLFPQRLKSDYAHYLVYPARNAQHPALQAFRTWVLAEARAWASEDASRAAAPVRRRRR
jgi:LysR family glycine cleavage system transcriptional activator